MLMFAARFSTKSIVTDVGKNKNTTPQCGEYRLKPVGEILKIRKWRQMMTYLAGGASKENTTKEESNPNDRKDNQDNIMMSFTAYEERQSSQGNNQC